MAMSTLNFPQLQHLRHIKEPIISFLCRAFSFYLFSLVSAFPITISVRCPCRVWGLHVHRVMPFVPAYPAQYTQPSPVVLYPNDLPIQLNHQYACRTEDILAAGQRDAECRGRRRITRQQATVLEHAFSENTKPNRTVRQDLAQVLSISPRNVQVSLPHMITRQDLLTNRFGFRIDARKQRY
jgi:Homeodomain